MTHAPRLILITSLLVCLALLAAGAGAAHAAPQTLTVTSTDDTNDATCDGTHCSLREAINAANGNANLADLDQIVFAPGVQGSAIQLASSLPGITQPVDANGCATPANPSPSPTAPCVGVKGVNTPENCPTSTCAGGTAFSFSGAGAAGSFVRGFALSRLGDAIVIGNAAGITVKNNWIGFNLGAVADTNGHVGIAISTAGSNSVIGGTGGPGDRNVLGTNFSRAISIFRADDVSIVGNFIGVAPDGITAAPNGDGIRVTGVAGDTPDAATGTVIGGTPSAGEAATAACDGPCNVIASSTAQHNPSFGDTSPGHGIALDAASSLGASGTTIKGNHIGTDATATSDRGSSGHGIHVGTAQGTTIGGAAAGEGNVIAGSNASGVDVAGGDGTTILAAFIGTNAAGASFPTTGPGVRLGDGSTLSAIGGDTAGGENVISNSGGDAIEIQGSDSDDNAIKRNRGTANGGLFIDLGADGAGNAVGGPNNGMQAPTVAAASTMAASGTAQPNAVVRVFSAPASGRVDAFLAETTADGGGSWNVAYSAIPNGTPVAATQTVGSNSSELSATVAATDATPPDTIFDAGPSGETTNRTPTFEFHSTEAGSSFQCSLDDGPFTACSSPHTTATLADGPHTLQVRAIDPSTNVDPTPASRPFTVVTPATTTSTGGSTAAGATASSSSGSPAASAPDTVNPVVSALSVSPLAFSPVLTAPSIAAARGATVRYTLSEPALVRFTLVRQLPGRRVGRRCVRPRRGRRGAACVRFVAVRGSFTHAGAAGANRFRFTGWVGGRALAVGRYLLTGVAMDGAGRRSAAVRRAFRIVR